MMKKAVKIPVIVVSSVVAAVLIAVIIMCAIIIRPMNDFMNYDTVRLATAEHTIPDGAFTAESKNYKAQLDKGLKDTGFSVMHATLEYVGSYGPKFVTEKDGDDDVRVQRTVSQAISDCSATADSYRLELHFPEERTVKVEGETVAYDNLVMNVKTTAGELRWVTVYLYLDKYNGYQNEESYDYRTTAVCFRMNTSPLFNALGNITGDFEG